MYSYFDSTTFYSYYPWLTSLIYGQRYPIQHYLPGQQRQITSRSVHTVRHGASVQLAEYYGIYQENWEQAAQVC